MTTPIRKLWNMFANSTATIFDYSRGVHRYTPQQERDIEEVRKNVEEAGLTLPVTPSTDKPEKPS